jgi:hypothetical protein
MTPAKMYDSIIDGVADQLSGDECLLMKFREQWYAFGKCAYEASKVDSMLFLFRDRDLAEYVTHRDDEAWLCSFLAKMVRSGRSVALAEDRGDGYKVTRVIRPGGVK